MSRPRNPPLQAMTGDSGSNSASAESKEVDFDWDPDAMSVELEAGFRAAKTMGPEQLHRLERERQWRPEQLALCAVALALRQGVPAPAWAAEAFLQALARYDQFEVASLGEAFGCANHKHRKAKRTQLEMGVIYARVKDERQRRQGSKARMRGEESVDATVGKKHGGLSASTVRDMRRAWGEKRGSAPDELPGSDAKKAIFEALAEGLSKSKADGEDIQ